MSLFIQLSGGLESLIIICEATNLRANAFEAVPNRFRSIDLGLSFRRLSYLNGSEGLFIWQII